MSIPAGSLTAHYGLALAPAGLFLAQELANSGLPAAAADDPLLSVDTAGAWIDGTASLWASRTGQEPPLLPIAERDLAQLRRARQRLRDWLTTGQPAAPALELVVIGLDAEGAVSYGPGGAGAAGLEAMIAIELLLAARTGTLRRLKVCANPDCGAAFYDESPNSSRRWHDVKTCGNAANLRASRARRNSQTG